MEYKGFILPDWKNFDQRHFDEVELPVIEEIVERFNEGNELVILSAPTGVGKTAIAECIGQRLNLQRIYNCTSLILMDQFTKDFTWAKQIRGRANYSPNFCEPWELTFSTEPTCADCDIDYASNLCSLCQDADRCPYSVAKDEAAGAELACSNTAYFLNECNGGKSRFTGRELVITDEADQHPEIIMGQVSVSISQRMQRRLGIKPPRYKTKEDSWVEWFDYAIPFLSNKIALLPNRTIEQKRERRGLERLQERIVNIAANPEGWIFDGYQQGRIEFKPVMVDRIAPHAYWRHGKRFLHMSTTIIPEEHVESLGFDGPWAPVFAPSVFDPARRPIYFIPSARMISKMEETEWPKMAPAVQAVIERYPNERTLILPHSYKLAAYLKTNVDVGDRPLFCYLDSRERQQAIEGYEATEGAILIAASLERGYDGVGDKCRVVILAKVPAPYLGDKQVSTRLFATKGGDFWYACKTGLSMAQAAGRAMRNSNDHCRVFILDSQFSTWRGKWMAPPGSPQKHRILPNFFEDALVLDSDERFEIRLRTREIIREKAGQTTKV